MLKEKTDTFCGRLRHAMRLRQISATELAKKSGYNKANISQWVNGVYEAKQDGVYALSRALNVNEAWLMGYDAQMEREPASGESSVYENILEKIPFYSIPVSAGRGEWLGEGHEYEFESLPDIPENADFALRVRGDSMEPMFSNGDIVFVKTAVMVESGQIGVFYLNDKGYMKMLQGSKLVSLNKDYKPIYIEEWDAFFCAGRVVGKHS